MTNPIREYLDPDHEDAGKRMGGVVLAALFTVWLTFMVITGGGDDDAEDAAAEQRIADAAGVPTAPQGPACREVVYRLEGTARGVDVTLSNASGNTEQVSNRAVPFGGADGFRVGCLPSGAFVYVSGQNIGESGTIECEIEVDGVDLEVASSSGAFVIATCSGSVP